MAVNFDVMDLGKVGLLDPEQMGYKDSLEIIKDESLKVQKSFVKIGWYLKHIKDQELYKEEGYANICECAADQLGYSQSTTSRLINICERFSKNGNTPELDEKYAGFDKSQMIEMLPMEPEQLEKVTPDMSVAEIRAVKNETRIVTAPDDGELREFCRAVLEDILKEDKKNLKEYMIRQYGKRHEGGCADGVTYRCSLRGIRINDSDEITWANFAKRVMELEELIPGSCFGAKAVENVKDEDIPGQMNIEEDFPEYLPESLPETCEVSDGECKEVPEQLSAYGVALLIPNDWQEEYLNAFAKYFISCKHDWMLEDLQNRVLNTETSPQEIKNHLKPHYRTWNFKINEGVAKINLFDDYIQLYNEYSVYMGNFEWLYLAAAIKRMWNIVTLDVAAQEKKKLATVVRDDVEPPEEYNSEAIDDITKIRDILEKEKKLFSEYKSVGDIPEDTVYRQKIIVDAVANMVCELENMPEDGEQPELPVLKNDSQRREWLQNYKAWGLWYRDENIDVNYYKFDFADGSRLVVSEYPQRKKCDEHYYHLLKKYDAQYCHQTDSETYLVEFLKKIQRVGEKNEKKCKKC